jgi:capsular polysaccharide biosynthesis protein
VENAYAYDRHNDGDQKVSYGDETLTFSLHGDNGITGRLGGYQKSAATEERPAEFVPSLVSLAFIRAAVMRSLRFCCVMAVVGLIVGAALYVRGLHDYKASTSLLLTLGPYENIQVAAADNAAMAESRAVAGIAVRDLALQESVGSFLASYTATSVTDRVLTITVAASSSGQAVLRANAVAAAFLKFRAEELRTQPKLVLESLDQQIRQDTATVSSLTAQIGRLDAQPAYADQAILANLRAQLNQADATLSSLDQSVTGLQTSTQPATAAAVNGSVVLDAATLVPRSHIKPLREYTAGGLLIGLILGVGLVAVRALLSDRLRRRDDILRALNAPVRLSVGKVRLNRWLPGRHGLAAARIPDVQRIVTHLGRVVPGGSSNVRSLAVIPVDDLQVPALSLASLAVSCAEQGRHVVVADLCRGAPAARLLGAKNPGVHAVAGQPRLAVAVPERDDMASAGPLDRGLVQDRRSAFTGAVAAACGSADLLLTLATLDPALGGEHLSTWATDAVAVITTGHSSWTRINAVGEMVRLSGTRLVGAVLVGADSADESLGLVGVAQGGRDANGVEQGPISDASGFMGAADQDRDRRRPATGDPRKI